MSICRYCGADEPSVCMNTRDMEDFAIHGYGEDERSERCYRTLVASDLGEKGAEYVRLNRERILALRKQV